MRERFAQLLSGFSVLAARTRTSGAPATARIRALLEQFGERRRRADTLEQAQTANDQGHIHALLDGYNKSVDS